SYLKEMDEGEDLPCVVMVYPVRVKSLARSYPERNERKRKWFTAKKAATRVLEPELARILRDFDPKLLG
ncbi:MAG: NUDIX hydrolase, partial [Pseudomonadota bacterium]